MIFFQTTKEKLEGKRGAGSHSQSFSAHPLQEIEGTKSVKLRNPVTKREHPHSLQISARCKTGERDISGQQEEEQIWRAYRFSFWASRFFQHTRHNDDPFSSHRCHISGNAMPGRAVLAGTWHTSPPSPWQGCQVPPWRSP